MHIGIRIPSVNFAYSRMRYAKQEKEVTHAPPRVAHAVRHDTPCTTDRCSNPDAPRRTPHPMHIGGAVPSSKTASPGDPVLCYLRSAREFGRSAFPRASYLAGRFSDAKDPGRLAGTGWMKLEFDRLIARIRISPFQLRSSPSGASGWTRKGRSSAKVIPSATRSPGWDTLAD
jgi:hypothetical protein